MMIDDAYAAAQCHSRIRSEWSGEVTHKMDACHAIHQGIGGGGITCEINYVLLTEREHKDHHNRKRPNQTDLFTIIAARYQGYEVLEAGDVEAELRRLQNLTKGSNPNDDRPSWAPAYPEASYALVPARKRPTRNNKKRRRAAISCHPANAKPSSRKASHHADKDQIR